MNEKFMEFFKDPSKYIKRLLQKALGEKWHEDSNARLFEPCPFCADTNTRAFENPDLVDTCGMCLCPPEICQDGGFGGMIETLLSHHKRTDTKTRLSDLSESELHGTISLFKARLDNLDCCD